MALKARLEVVQLVAAEEGVRELVRSLPRKLRVPILVHLSECFCKATNLKMSVVATSSDEVTCHCSPSALFREFGP